mmetsp:Transcript_18299/g.36730  ORF Transcript_18299/g.36730 Transcript_18299/m.36730 type:complete len:85 (+) Transcript_18299:273-527(+)
MIFSFNDPTDESLIDGARTTTRRAVVVANVTDKDFENVSIIYFHRQNEFQYLDCSSSFSCFVGCAGICSRCNPPSCQLVVELNR